MLARWQTLHPRTQWRIINLALPALVGGILGLIYQATGIDENGIWLLLGLIVIFAGLPILSGQIIRRLPVSEEASSPQLSAQEIDTITQALTERAAFLRERGYGDDVARLEALAARLKNHSSAAK